MSRPKPERNTAVLWNATLARPTLHDYYTTRECHVKRISPLGEFGELEPAWEFIYRCRENSADRRYGVEERKGS